MPIDDVATELARAHRQADPATIIVKYFPDVSEIRLVEVSTEAPTTGEILPFAFGAEPANGIDFPSIVILLSPEEWREVQAGLLRLPDGWDLNTARDL